MESSSTAFIFKGKAYSGAISGDLSILDLHIEFSNFSITVIAISPPPNKVRVRLLLSPRGEGCGERDRLT